MMSSNSWFNAFIGFKSACVEEDIDIGATGKDTCKGVFDFLLLLLFFELLLFIFL